MPNGQYQTPPESTHDRIVAVADELFYEKGFEATSFADIAKTVGLSRGNFYYHFKTKDEILDAVIARRLDSTQRMLEVWERETTSPVGRLMAFARILITNRTKIMAHGCPVGTLCGELAKLEHHARADAAAIFTLFRKWLASQFVALGHGANADVLAMHLLMRSQGIATLAAAYRDDAFVDRELETIEQWLASVNSMARTGEAECSSSL